VPVLWLLESHLPIKHKFFTKPTIAR
jgi:hypothetical protein